MIKKGGIMTKRDIFSELQEGMNAWSEFNEGKKTLKTHRINVKPLSMTPAEVKAVREKLNLFQAVFAQYLHTGVTTLQNWEQGIVKPNKQAVLLLKMVEKRPDTLIELAGL
ncbi:DNA-binding protein [Proteus mirabilis]|nr:DNA-binding protein [Proteus mirabilis]